MKFYVCEHCGNIIQFVKESGVPVMCCGQKMSEIIPGTSDGAAEKHVPVIKQEGQKVIVEVGSVEHPMVDVHYIEWIILESEKGFAFFQKFLKENGILDMLEELGIEEGDTVKLYGLEFDYYK